MKDIPIAIDVDIAKALGLSESIVISVLSYFGCRERFERISTKTLKEMLPFFSEDKISRTVISLEKRGMILSKVCNKEIYDRTKSYKIEVCKIVAMVAK